MSKLIRIPYTSLPEFNATTQNYQIRYRLKSEDGNKSSAWSPIYSVNPNFLYIQGDLNNSGNLVMQKHTGYVSSTWDTVSIYKDNVLLGKLSNYDFWVQYTENSGANPSDWLYRERISSTSMNENIPTTYIDSTGNTTRVPRWMKVEIYIPASPISKYTDKNLIINQSATTVNTTSNAIVTASAHGFETGDAIIYTSSNVIGGLQDDSLYWIRVSSPLTFSLYSYKSQAINNTNIISLTTTGSGNGTFTRYPFILYKGIVTNL